MLCTFCGTENRPEHKFCSMCGVRLERRQVERRVRPAGVSMKCSACTHVNEPGVKFCGMCGARVERRVQERRALGDEPRAAAIANAQLPSPDAAGRVKPRVAELPKRTEVDVVSLPRRGEPAIFRSEPAAQANLAAEESNISGPSFLGLNAPSSGSSSEYLLEDEPSGGGLRKLFLLVVIAAILGLVFMQWRSSLRANPKPVPAKTEPASAPDTAPKTNSQPPNSAASNQTSDSQPSGAVTKAAASEANADPDAVAASGSKNKDKDNAKDKADLDDPDTDSPKASAPAAAAADIPTGKKSANSNAANPSATADKTTDDAKIADYKPSTALVKAQQYLRGHGVPQNCEQGLLYLHAATDKNDPGAAIQMAALYSSGICVKQDRVMAYRWFNSAHELQPGNMWIQKNMDQLWAQMTSQERRLAGY